MPRYLPQRWSMGHPYFSPDSCNRLQSCHRRFSTQLTTRTLCGSPLGCPPPTLLFNSSPVTLPRPTTSMSGKAAPPGRSHPLTTSFSHPGAFPHVFHIRPGRQDRRGICGMHQTPPGHISSPSHHRAKKRKTSYFSGDPSGLATWGGVVLRLSVHLNAPTVNTPTLL